MTLGKKLRELRQKNKMTLQKVAEKTGYSKALISRIENDSVSPSLGSLMKITSVLGIRLHELFAATGEEETSVVRKESRKSYALTGRKIRIESLCQTTAGTKMEAMIKIFEPGAVSGKEKDARTGEEWWHVLKGKLEASFEEINYELCEGDSIYVTSATLPKWRNAGRTKASALVVTTPSAS